LVASSHAFASQTANGRTTLPPLTSQEHSLSILLADMGTAWLCYRKPGLALSTGMSFIIQDYLPKQLQLTANKFHQVSNLLAISSSSGGNERHLGHWRRRYSWQRALTPSPTWKEWEPNIGSPAFIRSEGVTRSGRAKAHPSRTWSFSHAGKSPRSRWKVSCFCTSGLTCTDCVYSEWAEFWSCQNGNATEESSAQPGRSVMEKHRRLFAEDRQALQKQANRGDGEQSSDEIARTLTLRPTWRRAKARSAARRAAGRTRQSRRRCRGCAQQR